MTFDALRGVKARPPGLPIVDGVLHGEPILPAVPAYELSAALRNANEPYRGITSDGSVRQGLYELTDIAADRASAVDAAVAYLGALPDNERMVGHLAMDSVQWRTWTNALPMWVATGLRLDRIPQARRELALKVVEQSLGPHGFTATRDCMRLNGALGELVDAYRDSLTEFTYYFTVFGDPASGGAWGWQLAGHHVDLNCVFVGNQLVLAPMFLGAEPNFALHGTYAGTRALDAETNGGLAMRRAMRADQEEQFLLGTSMLSADLPPELGGPFNGRHLAGAGQDNRVIPYEGIPGEDLTSEQLEMLLGLVDVYLGRMPTADAAHKRRQVEDHLSETHFAWRGGYDDVAAFYYRIHSPVLLVEYDNHPGIFLDNDEPERFHVHTIVREPNGNDYGADLLAQHYARHHS